MVERGGGRLKLTLIADTKKKMMQPVFEKHITEQVGTIYCDDHMIYLFAVGEKFPGKHKTINHKRTYAVGDTDTNTIENAFSLFKKGLYGSFHHVSKKHLARYCDEFSFRFNRRAQQQQLFADTIKNLLNCKTLSYEKLTASEVSES